MATDDLSRSAYYSRKRYSGVRMQQGRVLTDDDFNEQEHINHEDKRLTRRDVIGRAGSPDQGFAVDNVEVTADGNIDFDILAGTFYLSGLRVPLPEKQQFRLQYDWLQRPEIAAPESERHDMVYLEVWEQKVSSVEDSELIEKALGGPDTTTRRRIMARVKIQEDVGTNYCPEAWQQVKSSQQSAIGGAWGCDTQLSSDATLTVDYEENGEEEDLCSPSVLAGYLGAENQAIRVQLVDNDHFTWGFDNGAPLYRATLEDAASSRNTLKFLTEPKDQAHWPQAGQVVEVLPWSAVLLNGEKLAEELSPGHLSALAGSYDPDTGEITLTTALPANFGEQWKNRADKTTLETIRFGTEDLESEYFFLRVWDRGSDTSSDPKIAVGSKVVLGNTGINVTVAGANRMPGDHWIIAARPHTPDQVVPWELEVQRAPEGYHRFYAPLALIHWHAPGAAEPIVYDCRKKFRPLTDLKGCCTYEVGDGVDSSGDFDSIEEAVRHLPDQGGRICVLPGVHHANLRVVDRENIHIAGCGAQSIVHPTVETLDQPIFSFSSCRNIKIDNLTLMTDTGSAVEVKDALDAANASVGVTIERNRIFALTHAINIRVKNELAGKNAIRIRDNIIGMWDLEDSDVAIFTGADDVLIHNNEIRVVPAPDPQDPDDPRDPEGPDSELYDPCGDHGKYYGQALWIMQVVNSTLYYLTLAWDYKQFEYKAKGGVQIGGGSEQVRIVNNAIVGGWGHGVTLGDVPNLVELYEGAVHGVPIDIRYYDAKKPFVDDVQDKDLLGRLQDKFNAYLYAIAIEDNRIRNMGMSGVSVAVFTNLEKIGLLVHAQDITINRNQIMNCVQQIPEERPAGMEREAGFGGIALASCENVMIQENRIERNGRSQLEPICGVLILYGENLDISNNRILDNGPRTIPNDTRAVAGLRGGIVITMSFKQVLVGVLQEQETASTDCVPAVRLHQNIVTQPLGQALFLLGLGPVSIVGNQLTSQGADYRVNIYSLMACAVLVLNLGISKDLLGALLLTSFKLLATNNTALLSNRAIAIGAIDVQALLRALFYFPDGHTLFANNQVKLDQRSIENTFAFGSQLLASLDDVSYNGNQSEITSTFLPGFSVDIVWTDVALFGATLRSNDNRFQEGFTITFNSLFSYGFLNTAVSNQATHCMMVYGARREYSGNLVVYDAECAQDYLSIGRLIKIPEYKLMEATT